MRTYKSQSKSSRQSDIRRSKFQPGNSDLVNSRSLHQNTGESEKTTPRPWGLMLGNVMRWQTSKQSDSGQDTAIQPKLVIGSTSDQYEKQADHASAIVVQHLHQSKFESKSASRQPLISTTTPLPITPITSVIQRDSESTRSNSETSNGLDTSSLQSSIQQMRGKGQSLSPQVRKPMEQAFGRDFSQVRVHTNRQADQLNQQLHSHAFTTGQDVFFRRGAYRPDRQSGQQLIAHELTHVVQQRGNTLQRASENSSTYIQRAVGLELECTNLLITQEPSSAKKGSVIAEYPSDNCRMTYEETFKGDPVVEFVVEPAAETKDELTRSAEKMAEIAQSLDNGQTTKIGRYGIKQEGPIEGAVQATIGVPLENLPQVFPEFIEQTGSGTATAYQRFQNLIEHKTTTRKDWKKLGVMPFYYKTVTEDISEKAPDGTKVRDLPAETQGFILLAMEYIKRGAVPKNLRGIDAEHGPKIPFAKGLFPLMARTDFTSIFKALPPSEQARIAGLDRRSNKVEMKDEWWKWLIKKALGDDNLTDRFLSSDPFFNQIHSNMGRVPTRPLRSQFLKNIPNQDLLLEREFLGLGALKNKADVSAADPNKLAPIFELRSPYGSSVPYSQWKAVAGEVWDKYDKIVGGQRFNKGGRIV